MRPAFSIIFFTTLSGVGFGIIFWVCFYLLFMIEIGAERPIIDFILVSIIASAFDSSWDNLILTLIAPLSLFIGVAIASVGLISSVFHLKRPFRAWRALSQWRSSWLSREGVSAILCLFSTTLLLIFVQIIVFGSFGLRVHYHLVYIFALFSGLLSLLTIYSTAMIYAQLKAVRAWYTILTPLMYLGFSLSSGFTLWLVVIQMQFDKNFFQLSILEQITFFVIHVLSWYLMYFWWRRKDKKNLQISTIDTATRLNHLGKIDPFEPPHMEPNYLTSEMGYKIEHKLVKRLRLLSIVLGFLGPIIILFFNLPLLLGFLALILGIGITRWLFFAEAGHASMIYYYGKA